jgi:hypothetical protein
MASYIINISGGGGISAQEAQTMLNAYQPKLVSGQNIKTVNNESLLITDSDTDITIGS